MKYYVHVFPVGDNFTFKIDDETTLRTDGLRMAPTNHFYKSANEAKEEALKILKKHGVSDGSITFR